MGKRSRRRHAARSAGGGRRTGIVAAAVLAATGIVATGVVYGVTNGGASGDRETAAAPGSASQTATKPAASPEHKKPLAPLEKLPKNDPKHGMVYKGLKPAPKSDSCVGVYKVVRSGLCTHGPDEPPKGVDIHRTTPPAVKASAPKPDLNSGDAHAPSSKDLLKDAPPVLDAQKDAGQQTAAAQAPAAGDGDRTAAAGGQQVVCDGDGATGNRVQVLYVHAPGQSRYGQYVASFKQWAAGADLIYTESAKETGGTRHIRYVTGSDCTPTVLDVELPASSLGEFSATNNALAERGYNRRDRKYMIFADAQVYCGIGSFAGDERPDASNQSNFGPSYGRTDSGCWSASTAAHELGHNLGAVNNSAPNTSRGAHCTDEWDIMCYSDTPYYPQMRTVCPERGHDERLDCNHDDYFNTAPRPGSYLATHWNVANNQFLIKGGSSPDPDPSPTAGPKPVVGTITADTASLSWQAVNSAASYDIVLNDQSIGSVTTAATRIVNLRPDTDYTVAIAVKDRDGHTSKPGPKTSFHTTSAGDPTKTITSGKPYALLNPLTGKAADLYGGSSADGTVLIGWQRHGYANQQWVFRDAGGGYLRIESVLSHKCLQVGGSLQAGAYVMQQPCSSAASQQWKTTASGSTWTLAPKGTDLLLGVSARDYYGGTLLELQRPDSRGQQNWTAQPVS
ncbi:RICIN domain-containing protein [Streptomyces lydicus]|uniref:RICIN domain-containing protein n=1 Tax=Streptomyces lydicus TaxID=47763 RepID=UPI0034461BC6